MKRVFANNRSSGPLFYLGVGWLALLYFVSIAFGKAVLSGFERYDHVTDRLAFLSLEKLGLLPNNFYHDLAMGIGFMILGLAAVIIPALAGVRRAWLPIGFLFLALNIYWWVSVENEVAEALNRPFFFGFDFSVLRTYLGNFAGATIGAFIGQTLIDKLFHRNNIRF